MIISSPARSAVNETLSPGLRALKTRPPDMIRLFLLGLPVLLAGTWLGLSLYGRVNEATFRKVVLVLLLLSGAALVV